MSSTPDRDLEPELEQTAGPVGLPDPDPAGAPPPGFSRPGGAGPDSAAGYDSPPTTPTTTSTGDEPGGPHGVGLDEEWDGPYSPRRPGLGTAKTIAPFLAELIEGAGTIANERAQERDSHPEQWLADVNDVSIAEPLARIIGRLLPVSSALGEPNLKDAIEAAVILARYAMKQVNLAASWRRQRAQHAAA